MESSNPCVRNEYIDRISSLPDSTLGEILSYLSIEQMVATSILSTRWKSLFPSSVPLTELVLDDSPVLRHPRGNSRNTLSSNFVNFVDKLLNVTLRDVQPVGKVVIDCKLMYADSRIISWVGAALRLKVQHLRLMSDLIHSLPLFTCLSGCTTLVEFELRSNIHLFLPRGFCLPNLKRLLLYKVFIHNGTSFREFIGGCPVLNELSIMNFHVEDLDNLYIQHPFIRKLIIEDAINEADDMEVMEPCRVVIDAPNLETFEHKGQFVLKYVSVAVKCLHSVSIDSGSQDFIEDLNSEARRMAKLVQACSTTTNLSLFGNSVMTLYESSSLVTLPIFRNLTCLVLGLMGSHGWEMLAQILKNAPNLRELTFEEELEFTGAYTGFVSLLPNVPVCLELRIQKIEIWEFSWTPDEIKLIEYFLKNGGELQELIVHCLPCENTSAIEKLSMLPRRSNRCQVLYKRMKKRLPSNEPILELVRNVCR